MHRLILGASKGDPDVDHVDGDGMNNRRSNLRVASRSQNMGNQRTRCGAKTSRFKGVSLLPNGRWHAQIKVNGKTKFLGAYAEETDAATAYDRAARAAFGEFARTNDAG